jgi:hypothetical protein
MVGVELGGALKNPLAIGAGFVTALGHSPHLSDQGCLKACPWGSIPSLLMSREVQWN